MSLVVGAGPNRITGNGGERVTQRKSRVSLPKEMGRVARQAKAAAVSSMKKEERGTRRRKKKL